MFITSGAIGVLIFGIFAVSSLGSLSLLLLTMDTTDIWENTPLEQQITHCLEFTNRILLTTFADDCIMEPKNVIINIMHLLSGALIATTVAIGAVIVSLPLLMAWGLNTRIDKLLTLQYNIPKCDKTT